MRQKFWSQAQVCCHAGSALLVLGPLQAWQAWGRPHLLRVKGAAVSSSKCEHVADSRPGRWHSSQEPQILACVLLTGRCCSISRLVACTQMLLMPVTSARVRTAVHAGRWGSSWGTGAGMQSYFL